MNTLRLLCIPLPITVGEAVNFATHDWISHGADANERYRSFARPAVFSNDRLIFTMAHHLKEQKSHKNCKLLLQEVEKVVNEELQLRQKLLAQGVRDVSDAIQLPPNRLDQLDEDSADYDEKRLCHACKHICFFSAVACECSRSKVSCLRHSHYMCRCPFERRYLMVWSSEEELTKTCKEVRQHCDDLSPKDSEENNGTAATVPSEEVTLEPLPPIAVGVVADLEYHKEETININPYVPPQKPIRRSMMLNPRKVAAAQVSADEDRDEYTNKQEKVVLLDESEESDDEEIEVLAVIGGKASLKT